VDELIAERRQVNRIVLDASALLAVLNAEPGANELSAEALGSSPSSTLNLAEVQSKLVDRGLSPDNAWAAVRSVASEAIDFTTEHAKTAGSLIARLAQLVFRSETESVWLGAWC
jgi:PIN domain nuclease of toxin-antitoxin system